MATSSMLEPLCGEQQTNCLGASPESAAALDLPDNAGAIVAWISEDGLALEWRWLSTNRAKQLSVPVAPSGESAATSLAWCHVKCQPLLCVGFRHGGISLFTQEGQVLVSFLLATSPVLRIHMCPTGAEKPEGKMKAEQLMLLHDHGLLILVSLESLGQALGAVDLDEALQDLDFEVYELRGRAGIVDACAIPGTCRSLEDPFSLRESDAVAVVALGSQPFLSLHQRTLSRASSGRSLMATAFAIGSYAKSWVLRRPDSIDCDGPVKIAGFAPVTELQISDSISATELPVVAKFIDSTRQGEVLSLAPVASGSNSMVLAVSCDTFGRVALFCVETLRCLHLWKGYRDAQVAWLCSGDDLGAPGLVIFAPRRGLLELWKLGHGRTPKRVAASCVGSDCLLLSEAGRVCLVATSTGQVDRIVWPVDDPTSPTNADDSDAFDSADEFNVAEEAPC